MRHSSSPCRPGERVRRAGLRAGDPCPLHGQRVWWPGASKYPWQERVAPQSTMTLRPRRRSSFEREVARRELYPRCGRERPTMPSGICRLSVCVNVHCRSDGQLTGPLAPACQSSRRHLGGRAQFPAHESLQSFDESAEQPTIRFCAGFSSHCGFEGNVCDTYNDFVTCLYAHESSLMLERGFVIQSSTAFAVCSVK
jgi:hypothetical protein